MFFGRRHFRRLPDNNKVLITDDSTGLYSVYTEHEGNEIMFHVSTLLPFTPNNRQQLPRKRYIGNDIVTVVFQVTTEPIS